MCLLWGFDWFAISMQLLQGSILRRAQAAWRSQMCKAQPDQGKEIWGEKSDTRWWTRQAKYFEKNFWKILKLVRALVWRDFCTPPLIDECDGQCKHRHCCEWKVLRGRKNEPIVYSKPNRYNSLSPQFNPFWRLYNSADSLHYEDSNYRINCKK